MTEGDLVRCIYPDGSQGILILDTVYMITHISGSYLKIAELWWHRSRFVLAESCFVLDGN